MYTLTSLQKPFKTMHVQTGSYHAVAIATLTEDMYRKAIIWGNWQVQQLASNLRTNVSQQCMQLPDLLFHPVQEKITHFLGMLSREKYSTESYSVQQCKGEFEANHQLATRQQYPRKQIYVIKPYSSQGIQLAVNQVDTPSQQQDPKSVRVKNVNAA